MQVFEKIVVIEIIIRTCHNARVWKDNVLCNSFINATLGVDNLV